jgi:hypothetical protein
VVTGIELAPLTNPDFQIFIFCEDLLVICLC